MPAVLIGVGVALVVFGAFVLLRYSDRPGGTLKWLGLEVSSGGAGLPLIALGIGCLLFAALGGPGGSTSGPSGASEAERAASTPEGSPGGETVGIAEAQPFADSSDCLRALFGSVPSDRVGRVEAGTRDFDVIGPHQGLEPPFGIVLTDGGERIGAMRLRFYESGLFKVESVVNAACQPVQELRNTSRGGDPRELQNWDTIRMRLGEHRYDLRIGGETSIRLSFVRVA